MRVCALWCPDWPVVAVRVRDAALVDAPIAVMEQGERGPVVMATSLEARRAGVTRGLRRREAEARCAELVVIDADDPADARAFEVVVRAVEQLVPLLVLDRPGRLSFPTRGPSRYHGGDDALAHRVAGAVREAGVVDVRVGIGDGDLAAHLAARAAPTLVVPPGGSPAFLAPWSIGVVAPYVADGPGLADLLVRLGLGTLGAFAALPETAVLARFGLPGVHAHRLARGDGVHGASPLPAPPELVETVELDPPAVRVDEAAFAAKAVADRLLGRLDDLGLSCSRVVVEVETEHGERLTRCWRHDGALTPATLVARVRWQLEGWLSGRGVSTATPDDVDDVVTSGITLLRVVPDVVVPAVGRQLGFWGGDPAAGDRAGRALARVQGMLGVDAVATAVPAGGRTPVERVQWVPWGEPRAEAVDVAMRDPAAPWPGVVPGPAPARVFDPPVAAELLDVAGTPITVSSRGDVTGIPARLHCDALPSGGGVVVACAGPWAHDIRWWETRDTAVPARSPSAVPARSPSAVPARSPSAVPARSPSAVPARSPSAVPARSPSAVPARSRRRRVLWQVVVGDDDDQVACLVAMSRGRAAVEAIYD